MYCSIVWVGGGGGGKLFLKRYSKIFLYSMTDIASHTYRSLDIAESG